MGATGPQSSSVERAAAGASCRPVFGAERGPEGRGAPCVLGLRSPASLRGSAAWGRVLEAAWSPGASGRCAGWGRPPVSVETGVPLRTSPARSPSRARRAASACSCAIWRARSRPLAWPPAAGRPAGAPCPRGGASGAPTGAACARSSRSTRRAASSSRWTRGEVAPDMVESVSCTRSPQRDRSAVSKPSIWSRMRASSSAGCWGSRSSPRSGTADSTIRSRSRSRRSSTKRRGSWPEAITCSTAPYMPAASRRAIASTAVSSRAVSVKPSSAIAVAWSIPSSPAPAMSWSSTERVSRAEPPPARTTSGSTPSPTRTSSAAQICSR